MTTWIKPQWNLPPLDGQEPLSPTAWRYHSSRPSIELKHDNIEMMAQLVCALTRPASPTQSLRYIQAFANGELVRQFGRPHERFRGQPRKKRSEIERPFMRTEDLLKRSLLAGEALRTTWERARFPTEFGSVLAQVAAEVFDLENEHSFAGQAIDKLPSSSDVRKKLWSDFIPVVHIAMAAVEVLMASGVKFGRQELTARSDGTPADPGDMLYSFAFAKQNAELAPIIAERAEEVAYQVQRQGLLPRPERLIALRRYRQWGDFSPVAQG